LGQLGNKAEAAADDLVPLLGSNDRLMRIEAAIALVSVNPKHEDVVKKAGPRLVDAFGVQPDEKDDGPERTDRCKRARDAVSTLPRPAAGDLATALVNAIVLGGQFNRAKQPPANQAADCAARKAVYQTLEKLGAAARPEASRIGATVNEERDAELKAAGKQALYEVTK
jgi:hypothetical protein